MKKIVKIMASTIVLSCMFHLVLVYKFPSIILGIAHRKISSRAGGINTVVHNPPTTAANNPVVNSSPDILYSACAFDLSKGPLRFRARVPDSYWSISGFDAETNNFFSINNEQVRSRDFNMILAGPGEITKYAGKDRVVTSPTVRGVILFRTLVRDAGTIDALIRIQKQAVCLTYL
jgi:uncharacterized membrane protein